MSRVALAIAGVLLIHSALGHTQHNLTFFYLLGGPFVSAWQGYPGLPSRLSPNPPLVGAELTSCFSPAGRLSLAEAWSYLPRGPSTS